MKHKAMEQDQQPVEFPMHPPLPHSSSASSVGWNPQCRENKKEKATPQAKPRTKQSPIVSDSNQSPGFTARELPNYTTQYIPPVPFPYMSGYLEKAGDPKQPLKTQNWSRKYIEVSGGTFRYFSNRDERHETGVVVTLSDSFVSVQAKRHVRLESPTGLRIFRAQSEAKAYRWLFTISRYCSVAPVAEGFCKKLSGRKNELEERYVHLSADGLLAWYKSDRDDAECRGAIQVRGEKVSTDPANRSEMWIETKERKYVFVFADSYEASEWLKSCAWHSQRKPLTSPVVSIRNKLKT